MATLNEGNILLNGDFSSGLDDWNVTDVNASNPPVAGSGGAVFNSGDDSVFGDAIDQSFATLIGNQYSVTLNLREIGTGEGNHDFIIEILDDAGAVVETLSATAFDETTTEVGFTFFATSTTSQIRISNTGATNSTASDGLVDNVTLLDVSGNDDFFGGGLIIGGIGADTLTAGATSRSRIEGGAGDDVLNGSNRSDTLVGGEGADTINGNGANEDILDYSGSSAGVTLNLVGGAGVGSGGDAEGDVITGVINIIGSNFDDDIRSNGNKVTLRGLDGDDFIVGASQNNDQLFGDAGNDTLLGNRGGDTLDGGEGDDLLMGPAGRYIGGAGTDTASFVRQSQTLTIDLANPENNAGRAENATFESIEIFEATNQNDRLFGDAGDNHFRGAGGADTIDGGDGIDVSSYITSEDRVVVDLATGAGSEGDATGDVLSNIENLIGSVLNDLLLGDNAANTFNGGGGDDGLNGRGGDDHLLGEAGNDQLSGGNDDDTVDGGADNDLLFGNGGNDHLIGGQGDDTAFGGAGDDLIEGGGSSDELSGQGGADTIRGDFGNDTLRGGSGNDLIEGGENNDQLFGNGNNDTLDGGDGNDLLQGASGSDDLSGGAGNDTLSGGTGGDRLDGGTGDDVMNGGINDGARDTFVFGVGYDADRINGFDQIGTDRLELDDALWLATQGVLTGQQVIDTFGTLNGTGTILTLDFGGGDVLEVQNGGGIDATIMGTDVFIV